MEIENAIGTIIIGVITAYIGYKVKNVAHVEDIEKITEKVEEVKLIFTDKTEKLKHSLNILSNVVIGLATEEREAIKEYNMKLMLWTDLLNIDHLVREDSFSNDVLSETKKRIDSAYFEHLKSRANFNLFVENPTLHTAAHKLERYATFSFHNPVIEFLNALLEANKTLYIFDETLNRGKYIGARNFK